MANATGDIHVQRVRAMCQFGEHFHGQAYCNYSNVSINCNNEYMVHTVPANNSYYTDSVLFKACLR
jgi:hypothetical protein